MTDIEKRLGDEISVYLEKMALKYSVIIDDELIEAFEAQGRAVAKVLFERLPSPEELERRRRSRSETQQQIESLLRTQNMVRGKRSDTF